MYAVVVLTGQRIEVLGFVFYGGLLRAVWRDDEGWVSDIPVEAIRMMPKTEAT